MTTSPEPKAAGRPRAVALLVLTLLVAAPYLGQVLSSTVTLVDDPDKMDITMQWLPGYNGLGEIYREGCFPLWNPDEFMGLPWTGYAHTGSMYPPADLLFAAFDYFKAADLTVLLHMCLAAWGAFALLLTRGRRPWPALAGALVYAQTGATFHLANHFSSLHLMAWLPWTVCALSALMQRPTVRRFAGLGAAVTIMILGGDAEGSVYALMLAGLSALFVFGGTERKNRPALAAAVLALALAFLAVSAMSISVLELSANSIRDPGAGVVVSGQSQLQLWYLLVPQLAAPFTYYADLRPNSTFNHGLSPFYFGLVTLGLVIVALRAVKTNRETRGWIIVIGALLAYLALMEIPALTPISRRLPLLGKLASRGRMMIEIQIALAALAALGIERLPRVSARSLAVAAAGAGVFVIAVMPWTSGSGSRIIFAAGLLGAAALLYKSPRLAPRIVLTLLLLDLTPLALWAAPRNRIDQFRLDPADAAFFKTLDPTYRFLPFEKLLGQGPDAPEIAGGVETQTDLRTPIGFMRLPPARAFQFLNLANPELLTDSRGPLVPGRSDTLAMNISAFDNPDFISPAYLRLMSLAGVRYWIARDVSLKFSRDFPLLTRNGLVVGDWRDGSHKNRPVFIGTTDGRRELRTRAPYRLDTAFFVYPHTSLILGVRGPGTFTVELKSDDGAFSQRRTAEPGAGTTRLDFDLSSLAGDLKRLSLTVEGRDPVAIVDPVLHRPDMPLELARSGALDLYLNPDALPRAFTVHAFQVLERGGPLEDALTAPTTDLARTVVLEHAPAEAEIINRLGAAAAPAEPVRLKASSQRIDLEVNLARPGFVVVNDTYYPGWRAFDQDRELPILPADLAFRAVLLDSGPHRLVMTFQPASFRVGLWTSLAALASLAAALILKSIHLKGEQRK